MHSARRVGSGGAWVADFSVPFNAVCWTSDRGRGSRGRCTVLRCLLGGRRGPQVDVSNGRRHGGIDAASRGWEGPHMLKGFSCIAGLHERRRLYFLEEVSGWVGEKGKIVRG